jgi:hypothetical protein
MVMMMMRGDAKRDRKRDGGDDRKRDQRRHTDAVARAARRAQLVW